MRPVGLKRDNVIRLQRDPSGIGWPTCARCWQPVHGYRIEGEEKRGDGTRLIAVKAECCHKHRSICGCAGSRAATDTKVLTVPKGQSKEAFLQSLELCVFFLPDGAA